MTRSFEHSAQGIGVVEMTDESITEQERFHPSPLMCPPYEKAAKEAANGVEQLDYLSHLVTELKVSAVRESHVLELQRLAIEGIYPCGGKYRDARTEIRISNSEHVPPEPAFVPEHLRQMLEWINDHSRPALERAAYALWRLNWIHPFCGGNGRTSRCVAYLILCIDMKMMMPGLPTLPTLIYEQRDKYVEALQAADASARALLSTDDTASTTEELNLSAMTTYLKDLVLQQLASAVAKLVGRAPAMSL